MKMQLRISEKLEVMVVPRQFVFLCNKRRFTLPKKLFVDGIIIFLVAYTTLSSKNNCFKTFGKY